MLINSNNYLLSSPELPFVGDINAINMTGSKRRAFEENFRLQVRLVRQAQGPSIGEVCKNMELRKTAARRWLAQLDPEQLSQVGIGKLLTTEQQRIRQLEAENWHRASGNWQLATGN